jgi:hypothetical protein
MERHEVAGQAFETAGFRILELAQTATGTAGILCGTFHQAAGETLL